MNQVASCYLYHMPEYFINTVGVLLLFLVITLSKEKNDLLLNK